MKGIRPSVTKQRTTNLLVVVQALLLAAVSGAVIYLSLVGAPAAGGVAELAGTTARDALAMAEAPADAWAPDARLINARGTFASSDDPLAADPGWTLTFYSPARRSTALFLVAGGEAMLINSRLADGALEETVAEGELVVWTVDSPEALAQVMAAGGRSFLADHPEATLLLTLNLLDDVRWTGTFVDKETRLTHAVEIRADSGEVLRLWQSR
jgi:hypothetical protein